jgi:hypothetical protein
MISKLIRENFMLPMDHPLAIENIRRHISPSSKIDNVFSDKQLNHIWKSAFDSNRSPRLNRNGTLLISGNLDEIYIKYKDIIDSIMGEVADKSPVIGGNYFITPQQYGLHNDSIRLADMKCTYSSVPLFHEQRKYTCWKNLLIPLWIGTHHDEIDGGQIVFFDQRDIDWAKVYNGGNIIQNIASIYEIVSDYEKIQFYNSNGEKIPRELNLLPFDRKLFDEYMNTPYDRLTGLTLESAFDWTVGSVFTFDAVQLHNSNEGSKKYKKKMWNSKMGLLLTFLIELDEDLLMEWRKEQKILKDQNDSIR